MNPSTLFAVITAVILTLIITYKLVILKTASLEATLETLRASPLVLYSSRVENRVHIREWTNRGMHVRYGKSEHIENNVIESIETHLRGDGGGYTIAYVNGMFGTLCRNSEYLSGSELPSRYIWIAEEIFVRVLGEVR